MLENSECTHFLRRLRLTPSKICVTHHRGRPRAKESVSGVTMQGRIPGEGCVGAGGAQSPTPPPLHLQEMPYVTVYNFKVLWCRVHKILWCLDFELPLFSSMVSFCFELVLEKVN